MDTNKTKIQHICCNKMNIISSILFHAKCERRRVSNKFW